MRGGRHSQTNRHNAHLTSRREQSSNVWLGGYLADFPTVLFIFREPLIYCHETGKSKCKIYEHSSKDLSRTDGLEGSKMKWSCIPEDPFRRTLLTYILYSYMCLNVVEVDEGCS